MQPFPTTTVATVAIVVMLIILSLPGTTPSSIATDTTTTTTTSTESSTYLPNCTQPFSCGHLHNLSYPFSGGDRPSYCGLPELNLACQNGSALLTMDSLVYLVNEVDQAEKTMSLSRMDLYNTTCTTQLLDTTLNSAVLSLTSNDKNLTLSYACNGSWDGKSSKPSNLFSCDINGAPSDAYYLIGLIPDDPILDYVRCNLTVRTPVLANRVGTLDGNGSLLGEVLREGFEVSYGGNLSTVSAQIDKFQNCSTTFRCGNIMGIGYPFWGLARPSYCGHPDFHLACSGQAATVSMSGLTYQVLNIDDSNRIVTLARNDYLTSICSKYLQNNTIDPNHFTYSQDSLNLTIYYDCPTSVPTSYATALGLSSKITCTINNTESSGYYTVANLTTSLGLAIAGPIYNTLDSCSNSVVAPANQSVVIGSLSNAILPNDDDLVRVLNQGFRLVWDADNTDASCSACKGSGGACGYSNDRFYCYCSSGEFPMRCSSSLDPISSPTGIKSSSRMKIIIGLSAGAAGAILVLISCVCLLKNIRNGSVHYHPNAPKSNDQNKEFKMFILNHQSQMPQQFLYSDIKKMTRKFGCKLGHGGFGGVYKGELPDGRLVAVKVLHTSDSEGEGFLNEVASISRTSHVNIVNLLGYCYDKKKALVYQYMPKGSLDKYTYQQEAQTMECALEWNVLYDVATGTARGLEYLHRGCNTRIVHLDIKPHNVLLDDDFCPKISDFGLAKLCKGKESKLTLLGARGTPGYIAPEVFSRSFGMVSYKSDVYSYGMLILEMVGARKNFDTGSSDTSTKYFPDWIYEQLEQDEISGPHREITKTEEDIARKLILVGLWCIQTNPKDRPNMTRVIKMLEDNSRTLPVPPKPNLYPPVRSPVRHSSSAASLAPYTRSGTDEEDGNTTSGISEEDGFPLKPSVESQPS